ncbi:MAG: glycosyltransferase family 92 protein, partial [Candidatus Oxydemutatoraceae bacterium WSBS_2016_MAG_OTU14]
RRLQRDGRAFHGLPYDFDTICFDVFFSVDGKAIVAVCPPLRNLKKALFPLKIFFQNKQLDCKLIIPRHAAVFDTVHFIEISLPKDFQAQDKTILEFQWKSFTQQCQVSNNPFAHLTSQTTPMALITAQKNNPLVWIKDWCLFYHRVHGVNHILIYDNGSDYRDSLSQELKALDPALQVQVVAWDFSHREQVGALNHAHHLLGRASQYLLSFDIDAYLVNTTNKTLLTILQNTLRKEDPAMCVPGFAVGAAPHDAKENFKRVFDLPANKKYYSPPKPIFSCEGVAEVNLHWVFSFTQYAMRQKIMHNKKRTRPPLQRLPDHTLAQAEPKLYFYHHAGLNTFWKPSQNKNTIPPSDASDLVMQAALKRTNLPKQYF